MLSPTPPSPTTPTFLDIIAGFVENVAFLLKCDSLEGVESLRFSEMSGKISRFCC